MLRLSGGKIVSVYGRRFDAFGEYACVSDDEGRTWDAAHEIKLAGHFDGDLGYPAELPDGSILTVYYQAEEKGIATTGSAYIPQILRIRLRSSCRGRTSAISSSSSQVRI